MSLTKLFALFLLAALLVMPRTVFAEDAAPLFKTMIPMVSSGLPVFVPQREQFRSCSGGKFSKVPVGEFSYFTGPCEGESFFAGQSDPEITLHVLTYQDTQIFVRVTNVGGTLKQVQLELGEISPLTVGFEANKLTLSKDGGFFSVGEEPNMIDGWAVSRLAGQEAFLFQRNEIALWVGYEWDGQLWIEVQGYPYSFSDGLWKEILDNGTVDAVVLQKYLLQ